MIGKQQGPADPPSLTTEEESGDTSHVPTTVAKQQRSCTKWSTELREAQENTDLASKQDKRQKQGCQYTGKDGQKFRQNEGHGPAVMGPCISTDMQLRQKMGLHLYTHTVFSFSLNCRIYQHRLNVLFFHLDYILSARTFQWKSFRRDSTM